MPGAIANAQLRRGEDLVDMTLTSHRATLKRLS